MELTQIRYFLAVAESLNFTSAAKACAVSQPALSKAIRKLENTLGADLFDRGSQQVSLTEFGRTMLVHFERIEDSRRKAREAAKNATSTNILQLHVGIMCTIGPERFGQFLESFHARNPNIQVILHDVVGAHIPELLLSGVLNCGFCARAKDHDQRFNAVQLFSERMAVAFAPNHRFADLETVSLTEIAKEPYLDRLHCEFRDDFLKFTKASGLTLDVTLRSEREDWILELVKCGMGVSVIPSSIIQASGVNFRLISDMEKLRQIELVTVADLGSSSALTSFHDAANDFNW